MDRPDGIVEYFIESPFMNLQPWASASINETICPPEAPYLKNHDYHTNTYRGVELRATGSDVTNLMFIRHTYGSQPIGIASGVVTNWASDGPRMAQVVVHCTDRPWPSA